MLPNEIPEHLTESGAERLATRLQKFWHDQGYTSAQFHVIREGEKLWSVRSNLIRGIPPGHTEAVRLPRAA